MPPASGAPSPATGTWEKVSSAPHPYIYLQRVMERVYTFQEHGVFDLTSNNIGRGFF